jgi:serine/threonine protein kinase
MSAGRNREAALAAGTLVFMSRELLRGGCGAGEACDVWSYGMLMCQLLSTARYPVLDKSDSGWRRQPKIIFCRQRWKNGRARSTV